MLKYVNYTKYSYNLKNLRKNLRRKPLSERELNEPELMIKDQVTQISFSEFFLEECHHFKNQVV